ncbi:Tc toxin subunit A-related protein [Flavivirga algicola]|uniref:Virulence plasmid A protein n=1 Tax=Flavivirga algicola TaxID=2729136 RepID=A0ABX1S0N0_9FLAO|nr:neuraminidase-like domain-containing protein [Flavivirga algicola]NMH88793.1 hypothetical protein [Flavivirga algicola]
MITKNQITNTVRGIVTDIKGKPLANLKVAIYDIDMRKWELLSEVQTDRAGKYELKWTHGQLSGRGKKTADIAVKVLTPKKNIELYKSSIDEVRFNASRSEEINITLKEPVKPDQVEFDWLIQEITFLADKVAITDLTENEENRDVTFLAKELNVAPEKIEHVIVAHRLSKISKIEPDFFYGLLQKDTLLNNKLATHFSARLSIGIATEAQPLLYDAALTESKNIRADIRRANKDMLVSTKVVKNLKQSLEVLYKHKDEAEAYYQNKHPKKIIELLASVFKKDKLQEVEKLFIENKNDLNSFFDKVQGTFKSKEKEKQGKTQLLLNKLMGMGNDIVPRIAKERKIKTPKDVRRLAKLNKADWVNELSKGHSKKATKKSISTYASTLVRKFEKEYPTTAFTAQLEREKEPVIKEQDKILRFLNKHEEFEFTKDNIDLFVKRKKIAVKETARNELKSIQRIFKLTPNYSKTLAIRKEKIHSAQNIVALGKAKFTNEIAPKAGLTTSEANDIYVRAETRHTAAMLMIGDLYDNMSVMDIASFETKSLSKKLEVVSTDFPNLKSLFKVVDTCECEHCRSVYSPAAYMVEILQFLDKRTVVAGNAKSVLFDRRPDLGEIDLNCSNANTPVKYIDLVCELLEEAIAPDPGIDFSGNLSSGADPLVGQISNALLGTLQAEGFPVTSNAIIHETESELLPATSLPHYLRDEGLVCKIVNVGGNDYKVFRLRQTFGTAEELDAAPEYVNLNAYTELLNSVFAFTLPFDLNHTEAKAYLNRFDIARADLMKAFQAAMVPTNEVIAAERLGLSEAERLIISSPPAPNNNAAQQEYWNVSAPGNVVAHLKQIDHFLDRTELSYRELGLLLKLEFIDPNDNLLISHDDLSCDTSKKEIANLDLDALDRIHRFLRLQKKTGWTFEVLDAIITQTNLGNGTLDDACLIKAAQLKEMSEKTGIKLEELIGCFGEILHTVYGEDYDTPLYHQIFLNKARNGVIDEVLLPENVDGSQQITAHIESIATCLQLKQKDLESVLPLLSNDNLTFSNLSHLLLATRLMKKLKYKAEDFAILVDLSGINIESSPENALSFIETANTFSFSALDAADVKYVLEHDAVNLVDRFIDDDKIEEILTSLKNEYGVIHTDLASKYDDNLTAEEQSEILMNVLSALENVSEDDVKTILKFLDKDWVSAAAAKTFIDDTLNEDINRTQIDAAIDALDAIAAGMDISAEQKDLVKALLDAIADYQILTAKRTALEETLATSFKTEQDLINTVLSHAILKQTAPGTELVANLLLDNFNNAISSVNYPAQFDCLRLLHKSLYVINALALSNDNVAWYFTNNANMGWFELDGIPFDPAHATIAFSTYLNFIRVISYSNEFRPVVDPSDAENPITFFSVLDMLLPASVSTKDDLMKSLALLTSYEKDDLDAIDTHLFAAFNTANYRDMITWKRILECAEYIRKLSASVAQIVNYIQPTLSATDVLNLRTTLKSRYDESTWLNTLKEIMNAVRGPKRNALVAYLLATNSEIKDENDLYEYLLIDVEMEACMPSSRIVLAHNSIQLFVQRCLMGLEPDAIADVDNDPNWNQWQWMKNYRVWEANRKVFLYPENWYDVTLSDNKSYLLTEFIDELQQNELTNDTAEDALKKYLEKLDGIAFLEVMASWYDTKTKHMHVFARTKGGDPAQYYYRRFEKERYWTPWEKVDLDISGDILLAFMRNDRLTLAWPITSEEADPNPQSTIPESTANAVVDNDKPKRKLKIQLAISEYSNNNWKPKKLSKDYILTPDSYTFEEIYFDMTKYNMIYSQPTDQIMIFSSNWDSVDHHTLNGIFNITGCKGYPELVFQGGIGFPDFLPDFKDAELLSQRYNEIIDILPDELAVRSGVSMFFFYNLLNKTPGKFRITYPHQFTVIDLISLLFQYFISLLWGNHTSVKDRNRLKIPLGTLLPYFDEDSEHAYVVIPGFYKKVQNGIGTANTHTLTDEEKRTASDVFQLLEDIMNWIKKITHEFNTNPPADAQAAVDMIITDPDFQDILKEISKYEALDFMFNFLIGKTGNDDFDAMLTNLRDSEGLVYGEQFKNLYHPLVCALRTILNKDGVPALMKRETQIKQSAFSFENNYLPNKQIVPEIMMKNADGTITPSYPIEDIDFTSDGSYSAYNWDLFYRLPLHIAGSLTQNQRFEEALTWFHYIFNPTGALPGNGVQKYWVTKPFYFNQDADYLAQRIDNLMYAVSDTTNPNINELEFAIDEWREKPFRPDAIARFRPVAYQKAVLMKYIDNLVEWGDYLFRQDTMESVAQATQMYILADKLLGPKPRIVPALVKPPYETYNQIEAKLDSFGNALIELENILPDLLSLSEGDHDLPAPPVTLSMLYFCIPNNEKMNEYWDRVADRLFKIRHCQNIDGVERTLALFAPPIDPGMLVKAFASGLDISSIMAGLNAPTPYYRFTIISRKAQELAVEVRGLGLALLQALEKKDGEAMTLLRNELEIKVLNSVLETKEIHIKEAEEQIEVLKRAKATAEERNSYYAAIEKIISKEQLHLDKLSESHDYQMASQIIQASAAVMALIPDFAIGASGFGGSPHAAGKWGGSFLAHSATAASSVLGVLSTAASYEANRASILGGYDRRYSDWKLQERLAQKEIEQIEQQIVVAKIRKQIAEADYKNHELQIENSEKARAFMQDKFTNKELYDWMVGQISSVYFKSYQLAHDYAKKAERCYRFELGNDDSFISFGYWDSMKKGLRSADNLIYDIKRMQTGYLDKNRREYEITKHVSIAQLDPLALIRLRTTGICDFEIPEALYDMDHSGHYFRRLKTVSISIPCVAGPHTSISAKLSLVNNRYRKNTNPDNAAATGYVEDPGNDERFIYNVGAIQSIATSDAQKDSGVFELDFRDERYLPFENTGAISSWRLELPTEIRQFDYNSISDVVVHVKYTAREGGSGLKTLANNALKGLLAAMEQDLGQNGLHVALNMVHDLPNEWLLLKTNGTVNLTIDKNRLPYMVQSVNTAAIESVMFIAKVNGNPANFTVNVDAVATNLSRVDDLEMCTGINSDIDLDTQFTLSVSDADQANLEELMIIVKYNF